MPRRTQNLLLSRVPIQFQYLTTKVNSKGTIYLSISIYLSIYLSNLTYLYLFLYLYLHLYIYIYYIRKGTIRDSFCCYCTLISMLNTPREKGWVSRPWPVLEPYTYLSPHQLRMQTGYHNLPRPLFDLTSPGTSQYQGFHEVRNLRFSCTAEGHANLGCCFKVILISDPGCVAKCLPLSLPCCKAKLGSSRASVTVVYYSSLEVIKSHLRISIAVPQLRFSTNSVGC